MCHFYDSIQITALMKTILPSNKQWEQTAQPRTNVHLYLHHLGGRSRPKHANWSRLYLRKVLKKVRFEHLPTVAKAWAQPPVPYRHTAILNTTSLQQWILFIHKRLNQLKKSFRNSFAISLKRWISIVIFCLWSNKKVGLNIRMHS